MPRAAGRRRGIAEALLEAFARWGYDRIITPAFEYEDVLARGLGEAGRAAALRFVEPATGEVVVLRPDITPQVARVAATRMADAERPIRLCYEGSVLRLVSGGRGQRELIQAGVELIGAPAPGGDAEVIALAGAVLGAGVTVDLGHVGLVREALADLPADVAGALRAAIAAKDPGGVAAAAAGLPPRRRRLVAALPGLYGEPDEVLARAAGLPLGKDGKRALTEVRGALDLVDAFSPGGRFPGRFTLDLGEVRGFEYYTGLRFTGWVEGVGDAVLRGGRYDDLVGRYGRDARATGFAIDVEAMAVAEKARGVPAPEAEAGVLVVAADVARGARVAAALRRRGVRAACDLAGGPHHGSDTWRVLVLDGRAGTLDGRRVAARVVDAAASGDARELRALVTLPRMTLEKQRRPEWLSSSS